jgi:hypothetical protein
MWKKGFSIFIFAYGGTLYNAEIMREFNDYSNLFESESLAWNRLKYLADNGELNDKLSYTVMPVM